METGAKPSRTKLPMVCICGDEKEKAKRIAAADATREWVMAKWTVDEDGRDILPWYGERDPFSWLTYLAYSFNIEFAASVEYIHTDMWHGVGVSAGYGDDETHISVECDRVEDGLFAIWRHLYEAKGVA